MAPLSVRVRAWLALIGLQAAWSYRRLQSLGWLGVARPLVTWAAPDDVPRTLARLVMHFNTHPLFAPLLMGAALSEFQPGRPAAEAAQAATQRLVRWMGTFGAIGDLLYWRALQWSLGGAAVVAWAIGGLAGLAFVAGIWFCAEVGGRIMLFEAGLRRPDGIAALTQRLAGHDLRLRIHRAALIGVAVAGGYAFGSAREAFAATAAIDLAGGAAAVLAVWITLRTRMRAAVLWLPPLLGALVLLLEWG